MGHLSVGCVSAPLAYPFAFDPPRRLEPAIPMADHTIKGLTPSEIKYNGSELRIAIVHARWNKIIIDALVAGAVAKLKERGVRESNIVVQTVPGSFELPLACAKYVLITSQLSS